MDYKNYLEMKNCTIPSDIAASILKAGNNSITSFEDKNNIQINAKLQQETGYTRMENGYYLVSIVCPMPDLTREMIEGNKYHLSLNQIFNIRQNGQATVKCRK